VKKDKVSAAQEKVEEMSPAETRERIVCLCLVFAVVIFFWMAFHQNGLTLTWFADEFTARSATGVTGMTFNVMNLIWCIFIVYGICGLFSGGSSKGKMINALLVLVPAAILGYNYVKTSGDVVTVDAPIFQQFNPCFVVALTPISIALFSWLGKKGKEPKAPVKIGLGMLVAACAYVLMMVCSFGLPATNHPNHVYDFNPNLLISTYLILTFAELLLSPIGISFVTKVAPPKYKGMMMGGWFVATALGNKLVSIPGHMWDMPLYIVWGTLMGICLLAALFIFSIIKKLNKVA
jgi:POT family proton-dependent oligopeptide transporter